MSKPPKPAPAAPPAEGAQPQFVEVVRNSRGEFGDRLEQARGRLRQRARANGLVVQRFVQGPAKVVGTEEIDEGMNEDESRIIRKVPVCEITITAEVAPAGPEKWVRLTTATGPAAVEVLETEGGEIRKRYEYHPEDVRNVSWGFAETALTEMAGP